MSAIFSKSKRGKINPVRIFVDAVANEISRDQYVFHKFPVSLYTNLVIPRLEKLAYVAKKFPRSLACVTNFSYALWPLLLYPALLLLQVALTLRHLRLGEMRVKGEIFFVTSKTSFIFSNFADFDGMHICASRKLQRSCPLKNSVGSISDYIALSDIANAFMYSVRALLHLSTSSQRPGTVFQVYCSFQWFITQSVLNRSAGELTSIWINNDSDRWAVLVDQLQTRSKKIIVQHGLLDDPSQHVGFRNPANLPTRLRNIDKIILFDKDSEHKFRSMVLANKCNTSFISINGLVAQRMPYLYDRTKIRVMIIGQNIYEQECEFANYLTENLPDSFIFVKPHPSSSLKPYKNRLDSRVILIDDLIQFPYVEICICFDFSSLGYLYEKQGTKVIYFTEIKNYQQSKEDTINKIIFISRSFEDNVK